ncbi:MAG: hypothetical protein L0Y66_06740 [Myxococcaceae bacterium]|nr:hypothetical protein [Myxococcaceae bacterium]MCI0673796.1 hypothetical protein [Myxococcaceae bacterium]
MSSPVTAPAVEPTSHPTTITGIAPAAISPGPTRGARVRKASPYTRSTSAAIAAR